MWAVGAACEVVEKHVKLPGSIVLWSTRSFLLRWPFAASRRLCRQYGQRKCETTAMKVATKSQIVSHLIKENKSRYWQHATILTMAASSF